MTIQELYRQSGLIYIYIGYDVAIERQMAEKQKPSYMYSKNGQIEYGKGSGQQFSLLIDREYKPKNYAILLNSDKNRTRCKHKTNKQNGCDLVGELNMDPYDAPKECIPSSGLHCILYVDQHRLSESE